jgi:signal transduction histidine kinase
LELENDININGYKNELIQCFMNIFNNAKDALVHNNVDNKLIFISASVNNNKAIIKIKDNAGGISENILHKIFEPYFTTKHKSQGTGLGLHMTYNLIVDGMDGNIEAENMSYIYNNISYTGAEFTIILPIS